MFTTNNYFYELDNIKRSNCFFIVESKSKEIDDNDLDNLIYNLINIKNIINFSFISFGEKEKIIIKKILKYKNIYVDKNIRIHLINFKNNINKDLENYFDNVCYIEKQNEQNLLIKTTINLFADICIFITDNPTKNEWLKFSQKMLTNCYIL